MGLGNGTSGWRQAALVALTSGSVWLAFFSRAAREGWGDVLVQGLAAFIGVAGFSLFAYMAYLMVSNFALRKGPSEAVDPADALPLIYSALIVVCIFKFIGDARAHTTTYLVRTEQGEVVDCVYTEPPAESFDYE